MKIFKTLFFSFLALFSWSQEEIGPYNDSLYYQIISDDIELQQIDSLKIIIVKFEKQSIEQFKKTMINNPQLMEVQLYNPPKEAIDLLSELKNKELEYLFIKDYEGENLVLSQFPTLQFLSIESTKIKHLSMVNSDLKVLDLLALKIPTLIDWKTDSDFPNLGLIDLDAPFLEVFPIKSMPKISQFSFNCSFNDIPAYLCQCQELMFISLTNNKVIKIDPCFKKKIYDGYYSNLTLHDGIDGKIKMELLSQDRMEK